MTLDQREGIIRWRGACQRCGSVIVTQYAEVEGGDYLSRCYRSYCGEACPPTRLWPVVLVAGEWVDVVTGEPATRPEVTA